MKCKHCGQVIPELEILIIEGYEVTKPIIAETYKEARELCPKGFRLPEQWELFLITRNIKNRKLLSDGEFMFFWSSTVEDEYVRGLSLNRNLDVVAGGGDLADSDDGSRVVFVKENK